jgi:phosphoglycolate phosphatase
MALILFDFDGVLANTLDDMIRFAQETCDELGVHHIVTQEDLNSLEVMSFAEYGRNCEVPENLVDEFVRLCLRRFAEKQSPPEIFYGLDAVIKELSRQNIIAIVSGNTAQNIQAFLLEHRLEKYIGAIYGVDAPGSKAEKISTARNQFSAEKEATFMVGDSLSDIRAAKEASVKSIAVSWGHQKLERLAAATPDYLIHSPSELLDVVKGHEL